MTDAPRVLIVESPYYQEVAEALRAGATAALEAAGAEISRISVAGALEIPGAIAIARSGGRHHGFVALGCVIRGETSHYDIVAGESARGLMDLTLQGVALGNGILTVETRDQAMERADPNRKNKGRDAAEACLQMIALKREFGA